MEEVGIHLIQGPLRAQPVPWQPAPGGGAAICFEGIVRLTECDRPLLALDYDAYEPMTTQMLQRIGTDLLRRHGLIGMCVEHSIGRVAVGETSFRLRIAAKHRKEAIAAMDEFIDVMKRDVPLWKTPVWAAT